MTRVGVKIDVKWFGFVSIRLKKLEKHPFSIRKRMFLWLRRQDLNLRPTGYEHFIRQSKSKVSNQKTGFLPYSHRSDADQTFQVSIRKAADNRQNAKQ